MGKLFPYVRLNKGVNINRVGLRFIIYINMILHLGREVNRFKNVVGKLLSRKIFNFNEEDSLDYAFFHENGLFSKTEAIKKIAREYKEGAEARKHLVMLDIGCGTGEIDEVIQHDFSRIIGIDCAKEPIKKAIARKIDNADFLISNAEKLCFLNESFDMVILINTFHHAYKSIPIVVQESLRVLKRNGLLIISEFNPFNPIGLLWFYFLCPVDKGGRMINPIYLKEMAESTNGKTITVFKPLSLSFYFEYMAIYQKIN